MARPIGWSAHGVWRRARRIERHGVAEHDFALVQRVGQQFVRRAPAAFEPIGLRKDDVQRDRRRTQIAQARHELTDHVAAPRPLANGRQAVVIDVDNDDAAGCRADRSVAQDGVVGAVFPVAKERRAEERQQRRNERGHEPAQHHETPRPERHLIVISTRRLRGS